MSRVSGVSGEMQGTQKRPVNGVEASEILAQLDRLQASEQFRASRKCFEFLKHIVERTLEDRSDTLKERSIGLELFGRPVSYEPSEDATVRVKAGQVRRRLRDYYLAEGLQDPVLIDLPPGSYIPVFRQRKSQEQPPSASPHFQEEPLSNIPQASPGARLTRKVVIALLLLGVGIVAIVWKNLQYNKLNEAPPAVRAFWAPLLDAKGPVWVCASAVPIYTPRKDPPETMEDIVFTRDQFVAISDLNAVTRFSEMLTNLRRPYQVRVGAELSYRDLHATPAIMVGYSYSRWKEISHKQRFSLSNNAILDNGVPSSWKIATYPDDPQLPEDYALVARFFDSDTQSVIVEIAGITHFGTEAAGELVSNSALFSQALHTLPPGWEKKNVQLLLHVNIVHGAPGVPTVIASQAW